jgi:hypothetical protein
MGPGTHVIKRVFGGSLPTSRNDFIAMTHDINYLISDGKHDLMDRADDIAIDASDYTLQGMVMSVGLRLRKITHIKESPQDVVAGYRLKNFVLSNDKYREMSKKYGLSLDDLFLK